jgi:hypothetical protein
MEQKNKKKAIIGTIVFHISLALLLIVFAFRTPLPLPEEMGVIVGVNSEGRETTKQTETSSESVSNHDASQPSQQRENVVTQNTETTHNILTASQSQQEEKQIPNVDPRIVAFWKSNNSNISQSTSSENGSDDKSYIGIGNKKGDNSGVNNHKGQDHSYGSTSSYNLHKRSATDIPIPDYTEQDQGKVVVDVWVDQQGNVTKAVAGAKGTTTSNPSLWRKAQQAALSAKFSVNLNAPEEQRGTITYNFIRLGS